MAQSSRFVRRSPSKFRFDDALKYYQQALKLAEEVGALQGKIVILVNIAGLFYKKRRFDDALKHYQQALKIVKEQEDLQLKAEILFCMGVVLHGQGRFDDALKHYQQALKLAEEVGDQDLLKVIQDSLKKIQSQI
ncbi:MAG: tetratricopeptide repeat protein [Promethearchaeota archaeon]